jgi:7-cyano-7-deazaguanine synthase
MKNCVLLYSGGFDSTVAIDMLIKEGYKIYPLFIDYGQKSYLKEKEAAEIICDFYKLPLLKIASIESYKSFLNHPLLRHNDLIGIDNSPRNTSNNFLPFRNMLFSVLGGIYCAEMDIPVLAFGFTKKKSYRKFPDTSPSFLRKMNGIIKIIHSDITLISPTNKFSKSELVIYSIQYKVPIENSYSCYNETLCNKCDSCSELNSAFEEANSKHLQQNVLHNERKSHQL